MGGVGLPGKYLFAGDLLLFFLGSEHRLGWSE